MSIAKRAIGDSANTDNDGIVRGSNGNILESGDTVVLTKEIGKGMKKGMQVTRIRVGDHGDDHDYQANIPGWFLFVPLHLVAAK